MSKDTPILWEKLLDRQAFDQLTRDQIFSLFELLVPFVARCEKLERRVEVLEKDNEELKRRLNQNSQNSSKPPSSDPPGSKPAPKKGPSGKKPGGQPGHQANFRAPFPEKRVDEQLEVVPERCKHCDKALKGQGRNPRRHQVAELPPIHVRVVEYLLYTLKCRYCGHTTRAKLPEGISPRLMGPRLTALTVLLSGAFRMSKREVQAFLKSFLDLDIALGTVSKCEKAASEALQPCVDEALEYARAQGAANVDETGWKQARKLAWLWTMVTPSVTVFKLQARRNAEAMKELLGSFMGTLTSDRFGAYNAFKGVRQLCWAHLMRDFEAFRAMRGRPGHIGKQLQGWTWKVFQLWHKVRDGTLSRRKFNKRLPYYQRHIIALMKQGAEMTHGTSVSRTCRRILKAKKALWTFTKLKGVEPTNNAAERALRPAVLWRKGSFGTHGESGRIFAENILTVRATLKKQGRDLYGFLIQACQANLGGAKIPSLLPSANKRS